MMEQEYILSFFTPALDESTLADRIGCAVQGFAAASEWARPEEKNSVDFPKKLRGIVVTGSLEEAERRLNLPDCPQNVLAGIVFFGNCGGENAFMDFLCKKFPGVPFAGGSPAIGEDGTTMRILPQRAQVCLLLITDRRYRYCAHTLNVYDEQVAGVRVLGDDPRAIVQVECNGAVLPLRELLLREAKQRNITSGLTERFSIADAAGRNIHLIPQGDHFACGADLPADGQVFIRHAENAAVLRKMRDFYAAEDALIFGCAGVKTLIGEEKLTTGRGSVGLFMFGEVVSMNRTSDFAHLMLTRLSVLPKTE